MVHCHGHYVARRALFASQLFPTIQILYDMRGLQAEEIEYLARKKGVYDQQIQRECETIRDFDRLILQRPSTHILCVSKALKDHIVYNYAIDESRVTVIPCGADPTVFHFSKELREQTRYSLGLKQAFIVVFTSANLEFSWNLPEAVAKIFQAIMLVRPNAHLLFITRSKTQAEQILTRFLPKNNFTVLTLPHRDVARYLMAGDVGLLLREPDPLNAVASPVKFAEYMMCGLPSIITSGIGDTAEILTDLNAGFVLQSLDITDSVMSQLGSAWDIFDVAVREQISLKAIGKFSFIEQATTLRGLYDQLRH